jgi:hypothetical protein
MQVLWFSKTVNFWLFPGRTLVATHLHERTWDQMTFTLKLANHLDKRGSGSASGSAL